MNNKQDVCNALKESLRNTDYYDITYIEYRPERELVYIHYASGTQLVVNADGEENDMAVRILKSVKERASTYTCQGVGALENIQFHYIAEGGKMQYA